MKVARGCLWERVQANPGTPPKGMKRPATVWGRPGLIGRVKHLRGEEDLRHTSLQDFREETLCRFVAEIETLRPTINSLHRRFLSRRPSFVRKGDGTPFEA